MESRNRCGFMVCVLCAVLLSLLCFSTAVGETKVTINEANFPDEAFRNAVTRYDGDGDGVLSQEEIDAVEVMWLDGKGIESLKGIEFFTNAKTIDFAENNVTFVDLSKNTELVILFCYRNQLTALDISKNIKLKEIRCHDNQLTELDVSKNKALQNLICGNNQISTIDVSNNTELLDLNVIWNNLTSIDVSKNLKLKDIGCTCNKLTSLDISKNTELEWVVCPGNQLGTLDVSHQPKLKNLSCGECGLTELDLSRNPELESLYCMANNLTKLDVTKNPKLYWLHCYGNKLKSLNISWCPELVQMTKEVEQTWAGTKVAEWKTEDKKKSLRIDKDIKLYTEIGTDPEEKINAFVTRCYQIILGRTPDEGGLKTWCNELASGRKTASEIIDRFVNSLEYLNKSYNYGDSVDILYQAMLGRNADAGGKANWVKKLENGQTLAHVINGFCFSNEFRGLCDSYGIKAGFVNIPNADTTAEGKIKAFVQRCYRIILDREADPSGMQTWYEQLSSGKKEAAEIIDRFVNSPEFSGKNYNSSDSVEILYKAMLGRGSDAAGKANWVGKLDAGQPFAVVINGFCVSKEFTGICASYGIKPGSVTITPLSGVAEEEALSMLAYKAKAPITKKSETNPTRVEIINPSDTIDMNIGTAVQAVYINEEKAREFISRCYQCILGRDASQTELANWIGQMTNGTKTPDQIARGFLFSNEFKGKNVGNEDLVKILYKVYMNRDADPEGLKTWTEKLNGGTSLNDLLNAFSKTNEFKTIVKKMGE